MNVLNQHKQHFLSFGVYAWNANARQIVCFLTNETVNQFE